MNYKLAERRRSGVIKSLSGNELFSSCTLSEFNCLSDFSWVGGRGGVLLEILEPSFD